MVGGTVVEVLMKPDRVYVNVQDTTYSDNDFCAVYVERNQDSERIAKGDALWWQGKVCYWTPVTSAGFATVYPGLSGKQGETFDIKIPKIGYSGVNHPGRSMIDSAFG